MHTRISIRDARNMDLVDYLRDLGHIPRKIRGVDYWYLSPLRREKTPSFKVNRRLNRWYDYGIGKGGNLVDFAILYNDCTVGELMDSLNRGVLSRPASPHHPAAYPSRRKPGLVIVDDRPLRSPSLIRYLRERRIPISIADAYCRELIYQIGIRTHSGIGFRNDAGGFEIRSRYFKGSGSPKDVRLVGCGSPLVAVFEGFMDFLSFKAVAEAGLKAPVDYLVLNSLAFFRRARPIMERYARVLLYLDHDAAGEACLKDALAVSGKYEDASTAYLGYKDFNDWICRRGAPGHP